MKSAEVQPKASTSLIMHLAPTATSSTTKLPVFSPKATKTLRFKPRTIEEEKKLFVRNLYQEVSFRLAVTT